MAADPNVVSLQNAINRFANIAGFSPIGVDGGVGTETAGGLAHCLAWIGNHVNGQSTTAAELLKKVVLDSGAYNLTQIQTSSSGFATYLNQNANAAALPMAPTPHVATSGGYAPSIVPALNPANLPGSGMVASVGQMWQKLPTWGKVAGGVIAGLGLIWGVSAVRKKAA